jgi:hypothetical protein
MAPSEPNEEDILRDEYDANILAQDDTTMLSSLLVPARASPSLVVLFMPEPSNGGATAYAKS